MLKIKKVQVQGFWLLNDTEIDFTKKDGLIALNGINNDSFSSNGAGKSTLPNAICQLIYNKNLLNKPQKEILNKVTTKKFSGKIFIDILDSDKQVSELIIERDYSRNFFEFYINDIPNKNNNKASKQKELEKIIGLSYNTFNKLFFLSPSKISLFSTAEDTAQSNFIKELLSLEFITDIYKRADLELKAMNLEVSNKSKQNDMLLKQQTFIKDQLNVIKKNDFDIKELQDKIEKLEEVQYNKVKLKNEYESLNSEIKDTESKINELTSSIHFLKSSIEETKVLNQNICPTCKQEIRNADILKKDYNEKSKKIEELALERQDIKSNNLGKYSTREGLKTKLENITKEEILLENDIERLNKLKAEGETSDKNELRNKLRKELAQVNEDIVANEISLSEFRDKVHAYEIIKACTSAKGFVKERINLFIELFNGSLKRVATKALGREINVWVEKTQKDTFALIYRENGVSQTYIDLSSGTQRRVDILLCLALNLSIKTLTGVDINLLFLDEVLSNIDDEGKEEVSKLLRYITKQFPDKSIITVHHGETIQSDFTLNVIREDNQSTLSWEE